MKDEHFPLSQGATLDFESGVGYITDGDETIALPPSALIALRHHMNATPGKSGSVQLGPRVWIQFYPDGSTMLGTREGTCDVSLTAGSSQELRKILCREIPDERVKSSYQVPGVQLSPVTGDLIFGDPRRPNFTLGAGAVPALKLVLGLKAAPNNTEEGLVILAQLNRAITEFYRDDPTAPGVLTSWLTRGDEAPCAYVSIHRYHATYGGSKEVVVKAKGASLEAALKTLAVAWIESVGSGSEMQKLVDLVQVGGRSFQ